MSQPLKIFKGEWLLQQHSSFTFWLCFAPAWWILPKGFFLEFGDATDPSWCAIYYLWEFSVPAAFMAMACAYRRYFMVVLAPVLIFALVCLGTELMAQVWQLDPNEEAVVSLKRDLLKQCAACCIFTLILLQVFPWENLRLQTGP